MLPGLVRSFKALPAFRQLVGALPSQGEVVRLGGLVGGSGAVLVASLVDEHPQRTFAVLAATPADAERWLADLSVLMGGRVRLYPQREALGEEEPHYEIAGERVETIEALLAGRVTVVVTTVRATAERTALPDTVAATRLTLAVGEAIKPAEFVSRLQTMGYASRPTVLDVAQFAVRGGIVDVYGFGMAAPTRVEWWGDEIASIRAFDLDTQRTERHTDSVTVLPVGPSPAPVRGGDEVGDLAGAHGALREAVQGADGVASRRSFFDLIPPDSVVVHENGEGLAGKEEVDRVWEDATHHLELARRRGEAAPCREQLFLAPEQWEAGFAVPGKLLLDRPPFDLDFRLGPPEGVERDMKRLVKMVSAGPTLILCDNEGQLERLEELLQGDDRRPGHLPGHVTLAIGALHAGFVMPGLAILTDHEIFVRARRLRRVRRYRQAVSSTVNGALTPGDYVVHLEHGIGVYRGIETITTGDGAIEVAALEYEGGDRLSVPLYKLDQLERFRAVADRQDSVPPALDRLSGTRWKRQRAKTQAALRQMAAELLELYARRSISPGFAFPPDTRWQAELESAFLYEDTPDQRTATEAVKLDMERSEPMDRLIIGDVGYGKTEIAVRAAFKAAVAGKQVAVLVPTTILAEQHGRTFGERLADFPINIEVLSRFRAPAEQRAIVERVADGVVDIVVGTHRLLSKDVHFKDLGLLIVDEEQRFGVRHKERLKELRLQVDVLTLTATPIPRTLHQALSGLRDMSPIQTPPRDRSPVLTFVELWDDELLEEAMARELDRGGQVFFVHNRIETIQTIAERVRRLAPKANVAVGHGQIPERELDDVMRAFGAGEIDILVSTMIVESGLDVTNANTMIVHNANHYGLAQLYQLRGRVGRGHRRAFCYLIVPDSVEPEAEQRLKLLEHHTELGAGYWLAMRDLELRGAGNLLGMQQSGHAHAVGFELYMRWLNETVRGLKGEGTVQDMVPPEVILDGPANLADAYVPDEDAKLDVYRRLARATDLREIVDLRDEIRDRFGPLPDDADRLVTEFELRALGAKLGLQMVAVQGDEARIKFRDGTAPRMVALNRALDEVQFAAHVRQIVPLSIRLRRLGGLAIGPGLVHALTAVIEESNRSPEQASVAGTRRA